MSVSKAGKYYRQAAADSLKVDAIIVPGLAFKNKNWPTLMKRRVLWSWILYKNGITKHVIYSGNAVYTPHREAYIMGLYAQKLGIPRKDIFYDTAAEHSIENVYYSYLIAKKQGFHSIALATDRYQTGFLKRSVRKKFRTPIHLIPVFKDSVDKYVHLDPVIDTNKALVKNPENFRSIRERYPFIHRWRGTHGFNIPWNQYRGGKVDSL
jgi:hypothetical protein